MIDNYASRWPGSRGFEDDITEEMSKEKEDKESKEPTGQEDAVAMIWDSACKSEFGEIVKKSVQVNAEAHIEQSQMAYAGEPVYLSFCLSTLHVMCINNFSTPDTLFTHIFPLFFDNIAIFNRIIFH